MYAVSGITCPPCSMNPLCHWRYQFEPLCHSLTTLELPPPILEEVVEHLLYSCVSCCHFGIPPGIGVYKFPTRKPLCSGCLARRRGNSKSSPTTCIHLPKSAAKRGHSMSHLRSRQSAYSQAGQRPPRPENNQDAALKSSPWNSIEIALTASTSCACSIAVRMVHF